MSERWHKYYHESYDKADHSTARKMSVAHDDAVLHARACEAEDIKREKETLC